MASNLWAFAMLAKGVIVLAGGAVIYYSVRAARRTGNEDLWVLSTGLAFVGVGVIFTGWLPDLVALGKAESFLVTSVLVAVGLLLVVYSLFVDNPVPTGE